MRMCDIIHFLKVNGRVYIVIILENRIEKSFYDSTFFYTIINVSKVV